MPRILIADDFPIVRQGVAQVLHDQGQAYEIDEASHGREVLEKIRSRHYDAVLLDISMPGKSGLEVLKEIKAIKPDLPVLMLSMHPEDHYAVRALKAGAAGYLTKAQDPSQIVEALRRVLAGKRYVTEAVAEHLVMEIGQDKKSDVPHQRLSDREFEIFCKIASGKTISQIADELCLSVKTVSTYRARILEKMQMKSNADITRYALKAGLVE